MEAITKAEVQAYENCRKSGVTNMFAVSTVEQITGICKEKLFFIMDKNHYSELMEKHNIKRG